MVDSTEAAASQPAASFASRLLAALLLRGRAFRDVEHHPEALLQAGALVGLAGVARGAGAFASEGMLGLAGSVLVAFVVWLCAAVLIWGIGVKRFGYTADFPEVLRTIGFAAAPLLFLTLGALPLGAARTGLWVGCHVWATLALAVSVREALDVTATRALVVCLLALAVTLGVLFVMGLLVVEWGAFD